MLYNRVLVTLINQEVKNKKINISDADRQSAEASVRSDFGDDSLFESLPTSYRNYLTERQASLNAVLNLRNTPQLQQKYYDDNATSFDTSCVRHILVETKSQADDIRAQITSGGDFAALAQANSIDTGSGAQRRRPRVCHQSGTRPVCSALCGRNSRLLKQVSSHSPCKLSTDIT